ncbi:MAG: NCS2 family permease [Lachnospiraceae bacterium]|nr:NCS2 family permease [Candidatus Equihabitans merdae]
MEKIFRLKQNNTTVATEVRAGLTTFAAMAYIIFLNPVFLSETGMNSAGVLTATCLSAALGTLLSAFLSNRPFAMASGMGMNAYFTYTLCFTYGYTWQQALALTFISGLIFLIIALIAGKKAVGFIPENMRHAITAGIGLFILLIGLLDAGIVEMTAGFPALGNLKSLPVITALIGLAIIMVLTVLKVKGSLIIGMLITAAFAWATGQTGLNGSPFALPTALGDVAFKLDFSGLFSGGAALIPMLVAVIISMTIVDMFDTLGFLIGTLSRTEDFDKDYRSARLDRILAADAGATLIGALCGTSTVTVYAESASGVEAGGRTGLTAMTTAICFMLAVFFSPVTALFNSAVTAPALIMVGIYLMMDFKKIRFDAMDDTIPALITAVVMPFAYSITTGIGAGFISYVICKIAARKWKDLTPASVILAVIFVIYFVLN